VGAVFPALWLSEIHANLALHTFIATVRPSELASLTTFPEAQRRIAVFNTMMRLRGYRSLEQFELHYPVGTEQPMSGANYGWYQIRFHVLAQESSTSTVRRPSHDSGRSGSRRRHTARRPGRTTSSTMS
jgi:hypothetical protein